MYQATGDPSTRGVVPTSVVQQANDQTSQPGVAQTLRRVRVLGIHLLESSIRPPSAI